MSVSRGVVAEGSSEWNSCGTAEVTPLTATLWERAAAVASTPTEEPVCPLVGSTVALDALRACATVGTLIGSQVCKASDSVDLPGDRISANGSARSNCNRCVAAHDFVAALSPTAQSTPSVGCSGVGHTGEPLEDGVGGMQMGSISISTASASSTTGTEGSAVGWTEWVGGIACAEFNAMDPDTTLCSRGGARATSMAGAVAQDNHREDGTEGVAPVSAEPICSFELDATHSTPHSLCSIRLM